MQAQGSEQMVERSFPTYELRWLLELEGSVEQALSDLFGQHVIDADDESQRSLRGLTSQCIEQVATEREDFVGIAEYDTTHFRRYEPASGLRQKLLPDAFL